MVFSKLGMGDYNAFATTQIRIISASVAFVVIITLRKNWNNIDIALKDFKAMKKYIKRNIHGIINLYFINNKISI